MKLLLLMTFISISFVNAARASYSYQDEVIYNETVATCKDAGALGTIFNSNTYQAALISAGQSFQLIVVSPNPESAELKQYFVHQTISDYTFDRLNSEAFVDALDRCYGNNQKAKNAFVISMLTADASGKLLTVIGVIKSSKALFSGIKYLKGQYPLLYKSLQIAGLVNLAGMSILEARKRYLANQLTPEEKQRIQSLKDKLADHNSEINSELKEKGLDTKKRLNELLKMEMAKQNRDEIKINEIKNAIRSIEQDLANL